MPLKLKYGMTDTTETRAPLTLLRVNNLLGQTPHHQEVGSRGVVGSVHHELEAQTVYTTHRNLLSDFLAVSSGEQKMQIEMSQSKNMVVSLAVLILRGSSLRQFFLAAGECQSQMVQPRFIFDVLIVVVSPDRSATSRARTCKSFPWSNFSGPKPSQQGSWISAGCVKVKS